MIPFTITANLATLANFGRPLPGQSRHYTWKYTKYYLREENLLHHESNFESAYL